MTDVQKCFIDIIKDVVLGVELPEDYKICDLTELYKLSKKQDMAHIIAFGLKKHGLIDLDSDLWNKGYKKQYSLAQFRVTNLQYEYERVCQALEDAGIDYLPLKGAVIRPLYPEAWMRVSCDIDILVHKEDLQKTDKILIEKLAYSFSNDKGQHDQIKTASGFIIEIHYTLSEKSHPAELYLNNIWDSVSLISDTKHEYEMTNQMFYFYHIFHAAKHFKNGGCGVKTIMDTWLINHQLDINIESCKKWLEDTDLIKFGKMLEEISEIWFSAKTSDGYENIEEYILTGGIYGGENYAAAGRADNKGSSILYYIQRAFPSYKFMCLRHRNLKGRPYLLPYYWIKRLLGAFNEKNSTGTKHEIKTAWLEKEKSKEIKKMFDELGL